MVNLTPDVPGDFVVTLVVNDGKVDSSPTSATLRAVNVAPVANAGFDRSLQIGETGVLDGSASSDLNGDALTYAWSVTARPSGSAATVTDATQAFARFVPDVAGDYTFGLVVNDGALASAQDTVRLTAVASGSNRAPTADAGIDQNVPMGTVVTLDGSASSDPDGNPITYVWTLDSKPANSTAAIVDASSPRPSLTPDQAGTYIASLVVTDSLNEKSVADQVVVTVNPVNKNNAPVAVAGPNQNVLVGATVELDGSGSLDADGDLLSYSWSFTSKPAGSTAQLSYIDGVADDPAPTFVADVPGVYVIGLVVGDGKAYSTTQASVTVTAALGNVAPVASAGDDVSTVVGTAVNLSGALSSDANVGDTLTYAWTLVSRPAGSRCRASQSEQRDRNADARRGGRLCRPTRRVRRHALECPRQRRRDRRRPGRQPGACREGRTASAQLQSARASRWMARRATTRTEPRSRTRGSSSRSRRRARRRSRVRRPSRRPSSPTSVGTTWCNSSSATGSSRAWPVP